MEKTVDALADEYVNETMPNHVDINMWQVKADAFKSGYLRGQKDERENWVVAEEALGRIKTPLEAVGRVDVYHELRLNQKIATEALAAIRKMSE